MVEVLTRTRIGPFTLESAVDLNDLTDESIENWVRSPLDAVPDLPRIILSIDQKADILLGRAIRVESTPFGEALDHAQAVLVDGDGTLLGIGEWLAETGKVQPRKVFVA